ncbi:hypothetical protein [Paenibacillus sp. P32E]|uniref:hypothetical protein n=1 Tax=Paenibacillus sp. P32E TaxID=1349434 RepID=UPI00093B8DE9|nr:hypothetical protein [Paenibacillus sp. P32E]OKP93665.1 hypothetical protein A3848_03930 [Paenibacillus sp. P32E]
MAKKMIIKGVGQFLAKKYAADGKGVEVVSLGTLQNLKIDLNVELEDVFGSDGLFAIDNLVKSKSIEITATDAKFDLAQLSLMMGSTVKEDVNGSLWVLNEQHELIKGELDHSSASGPDVALAEVTFGSTLYGDGNFTVKLKDANSLLEKVAYSSTVAPTDKQFMVTSDAGKTYVILNISHTNKDVVLSYQRTEIIDVVDILVDEVPFPVHIIHHGSFLQKDGTFQGIETELYQCRAKGTFSIDAARATASTSQITLQVLDPERADRKLGSIKRYSAASNV